MSERLTVKCHFDHHCTSRQHNWCHLKLIRRTTCQNLDGDPSVQWFSISSCICVNSSFRQESCTLITCCVCRSIKVYCTKICRKPRRKSLDQLQLVGCADAGILAAVAAAGWPAKNLAHWSSLTRLYKYYYNAGRLHCSLQYNNNSIHVN